LINFTWFGKVVDFCREEFELTMLFDYGGFLNYVANFAYQIKPVQIVSLRNIKHSQQIALYFVVLVTEFKVIPSLGESE